MIDRSVPDGENGTHGKGLMGAIERCYNGKIPSGPFDPIQHLKRREEWVRSTDQSETADGNEEFLVPFFVHLPDHLSGSIVIRLPPLPIRSSSRRTSSTGSNHHRPKIQPLSKYLTQSTSSDDLLSSLPDLTIQAYDDRAKRRDFSQPIGFLRPIIVQALLKDNEKMIEMHCKPCWKLAYTSPDDHNDNQLNSEVIIDENDDLQSIWAVSFEDWINESEQPVAVRNEHIDRLVRGWKESGLFPSLSSGWRNEEYSIYGPKSENSLPGSNLVFKIERAASVLFGLLTYGAHLTAYVKQDGEYMIWVPRRSPHKQTWPSKLDNTVAGGITTGESVFETMIRESMEEASLEEELVRKSIKSTGLISYVHQADEGWIQPEIQYTFDLKLSKEIIPKPNDGECENFELISIDQVIKKICLNEFKPNSAIVIIDFLIRHGILNVLNTIEFTEICCKLRCFLNLPTP